MNKMRMAIWMRVAAISVAILCFPQQGYAAPYLNDFPTEATATTLSATDVSVIEAIAVHSALQRPGRFVAIVVECVSGEVKYTPMSVLPPLLDHENTSDVPALNFAERNLKAFQVEKRLELRTVTIIGSKEIERLVAKGRYKTEFPRTTGYMYLWLPGYNSEQSEAFVYGFDMQVDVHGYTLRLKRSNGEWAVTSFRWLYEIFTY